jgi:site-specific recombinase XerD
MDAVDLRVVHGGGTHRLVGGGSDAELVNRFLAHLVTRGFTAATVRAYAYDLLNLLRFLAEREIALVQVVPTDLFDYLEWQQRPRPTAGRPVVPIGLARGAAPATMNRRIAAARGVFEFAVVSGLVDHSPVPAARRSLGLRPKRRGLLGHVSAGRRRDGGRLVRQPARLPESLPADEVACFIADLGTHRDRAMALAMLLGGLRAGEVRGLRLADCDFGLRRLRVVGKGGRERVVPVDRVFFTELGAYLRDERPSGLTSAECFVVLRGPTAGRALTEAGLRRIFRTHRAPSGAQRVRPHRLRHTYGTVLAAAGIDLLVLRELMGHASPETTAGYVHLSVDTLAAEFARVRNQR